MPATPPTSLRFLFVTGLCLLCSLLGGCDDGVGKRHAVEGRVLVKGAPLRDMAGLVMFVPDGTKGNSTLVTPLGTIDSEGKYTLSTQGKPGAPAGWYKVVVNPVPPGFGDREVVARAAIHARYTTERATPLAIEVVAEPSAGAYDLKTTKN